MRVAIVVFGCALAASACGSVSNGSSSNDDAAGAQDSASADSTSPFDSGSGSDGGSDVPAGETDAAPSDAASCIDDVSAGSHSYTCDGHVYDVEIPPACTTTSCGLVVDVHGATESGKMEDNNTGMRALGRAHGYVVVNPNASAKPPIASWNPAVDDAKVFAFLQAALDAFHIDRKRVHFMGFSQGGMMSFRFLCKHADIFASVAPAAGTGCSFKSGDTPSREIPVLYMHGTTDALVGFTAAAVPQRDAVIAGWSMDSGTVIASDANYKRTRYTSPTGNVLEFLQHDYQATSAILKGHCYPGSTDAGKEPGQLFPFGCVPPNAFVWGEEAMNFFIAHPGK